MRLFVVCGLLLLLFPHVCGGGGGKVISWDKD
jgi:hypothetical protein